MGDTTEDMEEKRNIGSLFDRIAGRYDFLNHLLSLNIDRRWRRKAVAQLFKASNHPIIQSSNLSCLDVAIGTADLAIEIAKQFTGNPVTSNPITITGIDLSQEMMRIGEEKVSKLGLQDCISFLQASALDMPFEDCSFDMVTCAYGVRNFSDLRQGLGEMRRVLKPEGQLMILEFSYPKNRFVAWCYDLYFSHILPFVGRMLSKDKTAYTYLNRSVKNFIWGEEMCQCLRETGFENPRCIPLTFGITSIYISSPNTEKQTTKTYD